MLSPLGSLALQNNLFVFIPLFSENNSLLALRDEGAQANLHRISLQHQDIIKCKQWRRFPLQYVYRSVERRIMYVILVGRAGRRWIYETPANIWRSELGRSTVGWQREDCRQLFTQRDMVIFQSFLFGCKWILFTLPVQTRYTGAAPQRDYIIIGSSLRTDG